MIGAMKRGPGAGELRVLMVTTTSPWPPVGGGNVAVHVLAEGLVQAGAAVRVLSLGPAGEGEPAYELKAAGMRPRPAWRTLPHLALGRPVPLARWVVPAFAGRVLQEILEWRPDVVHVEQLQLAWLLPLVTEHAPAVLRQQNVESRLLARYARLLRPPARWILAREARRVEAAEARACSQARVVAPISGEDAAAFSRWLPRNRLVVVPAALPASTGPVERLELEGEPAVICLGSFDWGPNRDGALWFLGQVWPRVVRELPSAVLHLAGPGSAGLPPGERAVHHGVVPDPRALYGPGRIAVVPVRAGSGVRLRILEAWSESVPVVSTPVGAEGLAGGPAEGVLVAEDPEAFATAVAGLARDQGLARSLADAGRARLAEYTPERAVDRLLEAYRRAVRGWREP